MRSGSETKRVLVVRHACEPGKCSRKLAVVPIGLIREWLGVKKTDPDLGSHVFTLRRRAEPQRAHAGYVPW